MAKRLTYDSLITVGTNKIQVTKLIDSLIYLPSKTILVFFDQLDLKVPRETRIFVLRDCLIELVVEKRKANASLGDPFTYRLSWFTEFSETQLENLLIYFHDPEIYEDYYVKLWFEFLNFFVDQNISDSNLEKLYDLSLAYIKDNGRLLPAPRDYNKDLDNIFVDSYGRIDGLYVDKFRPVLYKSSTLAEIREIGEKYKVDIPRRLKKEQLQEIILQGLTDRGLYTSQLKDELLKKNVTELQRFALDNDIKASTELKKEEIIEYILQNAAETKENYIVPDNFSVYEKEFIDISDRSIEDIFGVKTQAPARRKEVDINLPIENTVSGEQVSRPEKVETTVNHAVVLDTSNINLDLTPLLVELRAIKEELTKKEVVTEEAEVTETSLETETEAEETEEIYVEEAPKVARTLIINTTGFRTKQDLLLVKDNVETLDSNAVTKHQLKKVEKYYRNAPFMLNADGKMVYKTEKEDIRRPVEIKILLFILKILIWIVGILVVVAIIIGGLYYIPAVRTFINDTSWLSWLGDLLNKLPIY